MKKLTAELFGAPDGEIYPRVFATGVDCPPGLEGAAHHLGILESNEDVEARQKAEAKAMKVAENKALKVEDNK